MPIDNLHKPSSKLSIEVTGDDALSLTGTPSVDNKLSLTLKGINNFNVAPTSNAKQGNHLGNIPSTLPSPNTDRIQQQVILIFFSLNLFGFFSTVIFIIIYITVYDTVVVECLLKVKALDKIHSFFQEGDTLIFFFYNWSLS